VNSGDLKLHPAANAFPRMSDKRFDELKADIAARGQLEPITLCDGLILDGRHRYRACVELGIIPKTRTFEGNPWDYVWSLNGSRRDMSDDQRYIVWKFVAEQSTEWKEQQARIAREANRKRSETTQERPRNVDGTLAPKPVLQHTDVALAQPEEHRKTQAAKAEASQTNMGAVARGDKLYKERPDLAEQVRAGDLKPAEAYRQMKRDAVAGKVSALPDDVFTVIYADPPWKYGDGRTGDRMTATGALHHYPTMSLDELKALGIPGLAADDSVLFLWATSPLLPDALELAKAWGFTYKAAFIWDKVKHNMGHYNSVRHEFLLICTRGSCTPENMQLFDSVQTIERTEHSGKPEQFRQIIETLYPSGNKLELFRRGSVPTGWAAWGNETEAGTVTA
jgi:N6-adenosine-specific RNA methylase IME4